MFIFLLAGYLVGVLTTATNSYPSCKADNFKHESCALNKSLEEFGK